MSRPRFRDSVYRPSVARAITSPAGVVVGSVAAAALLATGAPVVGAVVAGALAWAVPVVRAIRRGRPRPKLKPALAGDELPRRWAAPLADAEQALQRYRRALGRCPPGPLHERLEEIESEFVESVDRCAELARWGAEAEVARKELDPVGVEQAARTTGRHARFAAEDQREVRDRLVAVVHEASARLVLINGRLDEAVGRAVEMVGRAGTIGADGPGGVDLGSGELATDLRALRDALENVQGLGVDDQRDAASGPPRRATSAD